jgi:hypothetical protein
VTARDRIVIVVVLLGAALGGFWFLGLAPTHKQAATLQTKIDGEQARLSDARQKATAASQAKSRYRADYAAVASIGKAVPKNDSLPSLVYQLQAAAHSARIDFRSVTVSAAGGVGPVATPTPAATTGAAASSAPASGSSSSSSSSSTPPASTTTPSGGAAASTPAAPATQAASATLPPGASVGSAGFPTMPFAFVFEGTFFDMERFMHEVQRFVRVNGDDVDVRGRLLSIDGFSLGAGPDGFSKVKATMSATAYLLSPDDTGSATATPSASGSASTATPASSTGGSAASSAGGATSEVAR